MAGEETAHTPYTQKHIQKYMRTSIREQLFEGRLALNPGLNVTRVSFSFSKAFSKAFSRIIFSVIFRASNYQLVDKKN